jgi:hypothetical protein
MHTQRPLKKLDAQATAKLLFADFQLLESLLPFRRGGALTSR